MKLSLSLVLLSAYAAAYPFVLDAPVSDPTLHEFDSRAAASPPQGSASALPAKPPPFDPKVQYVSNQGAHAFIAPGDSDARGPCPGLNAMANHNYLPHNGIATIEQFATGTQNVFGMGKDLAYFLAIYGAVVDGTLTSWSIAGTPHYGIGGSHGNYETDSSPVRADLNQYGSNTKAIMSQFMTLYNMQPNAATANYNLDVLRDFRAKRFDESIRKNPYFYYGVFSGIAVSQAAFTFIYRFMSNKSAEYPEGILNKNTIKAFMGVYGPEDNLTFIPGWQRIPDNWYKRNPADNYTIPYFITDIGYVAARDPRILIPGCNQGKVNTFNQISPSLLSGGVYTADAVAKNPLCFVSQYTVATLPTFTGLKASDLKPAVDALKAVGNCPAIPNANMSALQACPGFAFYGGPEGPVAPGAIQS